MPSLAPVLETAPSSRGEGPVDFDGCSLSVAAVLKTAPSLRGEVQKTLMGVPSSLAAVLKIAPSSHELIPFVCLCANAC